MGSIQVENYDAIIIGAGLSGICSLYHLRQRSPTWRIRVIEAAESVGGTWYWNRYPGARVDSESLSYAFSFDKELVNEWHWKDSFATQSDILRYIEYIFEKHDLAKNIQFQTRIKSARWQDSTRTWLLTDETGAQYQSRFLISCMGFLSSPSLPKIMLKQKPIRSVIDGRPPQRGSIVNFSSIQGLVGILLSTAYTTTKHAVIGLTRTASEDYAKNGLRINAICPGYTETPLTTKSPEILKAMMERVDTAVPMERMGRPEEIADGVLYLCGGRSSFVTGTALSVDGGYVQRQIGAVNRPNPSRVMQILKESTGYGHKFKRLPPW
ncbi:uncharacterized protein N7498_004060 [Penicillium cinerascens]|uniref:FAD/NAD(P)-binding domain-containing protein n=1 Tax=Penicillium cinerascens TaxID=70096 RepID=A0A9W9N3B7_9EURO|nr:uncharacterized protein N7498_004060 [Penicillium cinerascens]KAJ5212414.1 hypothetical protein N7498_004060 [Penicillium cinerascens]